MGTKPCLKLGVLLLTGLVLAGCDSAQRNSNSIARNNQGMPAPAFPSGNSGAYANGTSPGSLNSGSSGANIYRGGTTTTPGTGFSNQGVGTTVQPGGFGAQPASSFGGSSQPASSFGSTPGSSGFGAQPTSASGAFSTGSSIPPVGASGPVAPSTPFPARP